MPWKLSQWDFYVGQPKTKYQIFYCFSKFCAFIKGQLISKANCQAEDSSKKQTNEFVFTSMRHVFVCFLEESSARKNVSRISDL